MIEVNLLKTQVPTYIDLPKKKRSVKTFIVIFALSLVATVLIIVVIYFVFIKKSERIVVEKPLKHPMHNTVTHKNIKNIKTVTKEITLSKSNEKKEKTHAIENKNEKSKQTVATKDNVTRKNKNKKRVKPEEKRKILKRLKKTVTPVFSLNIKLKTIPKPIKKAPAKNILPKGIFFDNESLNNARTNTKKPVLSSKDNATVGVEIRTRSVFLLKKYLNGMKIKYTVKKRVYKVLRTYDIYVGGLDSYPKIVKFAYDLKSKGYTVLKVTNINLLFYVCIDKGVSKKVKDKYVNVWSKTPFRILTIEHKKKRYIYIFRFRCFKKQFNLLKKKGYYPIILKPAKNGA